MRKSQKIDILKLVETLQEAHGVVSNELVKEHYDDANDILIECQKCAIKIGTIIENEEGEGFITVHYLEDYCEILYQLSQAIVEHRDMNKFLKQMNETMALIKTSVKEDIPEHIEVVFLPYKATLWDSMESIWLAAKEDLQCRTYVIPIPYFDKNADGKLGEMHYENEDFPTYVPITSYLSYDISQRRPDIIYIHNPYDEVNKVTTVHPKFYSRKLREYTKNLVYVPYFVSITDVVEESFCMLPGVLFSNRVILQSEKVRNVYIEVFNKYKELYHFSDSYGIPEDKFLGLGNPKYDKVITSQIEKIEIPDHWEKLIYSETGKKKKIILYNTTIAAMLHFEEKMLKKIENVLAYFAQKEQVVLLWRPHPLLKTTLQSMRPDMYEHYASIEQDYINAGWGIFDESADMYRAISISDAYYGDWSSVVELYRKTLKPILIQNVNLLNIEDEI